MIGSALFKSGPRPGTEYVIYVFEKSQAARRRAGSWLRHSTRANLAQAKQEAGALLNTGLYQKIEIQQKFLDRRRRRTIGVTLKIIEGRKNKMTRIAVFLRDILSGRASLCG
jgi:hypothetical protein